MLVSHNSISAHKRISSMFHKIFILALSILLFNAFSPLPSDAKGRKPSEIYKEYLARAYYCKSLRSIASYFNERTRDYYLSLEGKRAENEIKKIKKSYIANFRVKKEQTVGDMHYIKATGLSSDFGRVVRCDVTVEMIRETGGWKIMKHNWSGKMRVPKRGARIR